MPGFRSNSDRKHYRVFPCPAAADNNNAVIGTDATSTTSSNKEEKKADNHHTPQDVICHICGRQYTIHSIDIHTPQCAKLFKERQAQLPADERRECPELPPSVAELPLKERNEWALKTYNECALVHCQFCDRTFLPDRLEAHIKSCARQHGKEWPLPCSPLDSMSSTEEEPKNAVVCHICGRDYTTHSIGIHQKQCEKLWKDRQALLPVEERKPVPQMPAEFRESQRNVIARAVYDEQALIKCELCSRTFLPDRYEVHIRSCRNNHQDKNSPFICPVADVEQQEPEVEELKNVVVCHICGRDYTTHSIGIHQKQCEKLWKDRQAVLPAEERRPVPRMPDEFRESQRNVIARAVYDEQALTKCELCSRTFLPDRYEVHIRSCQRSHGIDPSLANADREEPEVDELTNVVVCHICGRDYTTHSIGIHQKQCEKLWKDRQAVLPVEERRPVPQMPAEFDEAQRNLIAKRVYDEQALVKCELCTRTFLPDRYEAHIRSCQRNHGIDPTCLPVVELEDDDGPTNVVVCHICGRDYTTHSIGIHQKQCAKLWEDRQALLPVEERKPVPQMPAEFDEAQRNVIAKRVYDEQALIKCELCSRTFLPDRYEVHIRSCQRNHGIDPTCLPVVELEDDDGPTNVVVCHICGRDYTTHSIGIHQKQCAKLWEDRQATLPAKERKPVPRMPDEFDESQRNVIAKQVYDEQALIKCELCTRTFLPDRYEVHIRSCQRNHEQQLSPPVCPVVPGGDDDIKNNVICHICGRQYTTHSIDIHLKQCEKLWNDRQAVLPEEERRPLPTMPSDCRKSQRNAVAWEIYQKCALAACRYCDRTFLPDRLQVHIKSCQRHHEEQQQQTRNKNSKKVIAKPTFSKEKSEYVR